jgi:hypothetical protein
MSRRSVTTLGLSVIAVVSTTLLPTPVADAGPDQPPVTVPDNPDGAPSPTSPAVEPSVPAPVPTLPALDDDSDPLPRGDSLIPDPGVNTDDGGVATFNYDIGYDEGSATSFGRKFFGQLTTIGWLANQVIVAVVLWFTGWAFGFDIIGPLKGPILSIADAWTANFIGPVGLNEMVWFILMSYVAFQVWRGRAMNAAGEFVVSVIALGIAMIIGANPGGYLDGAETTLTQIAGTTLAVSRGEAPTGDPDQIQLIVDPLRGELHDVLIEEPYEIINWGGPLTGACAAALPAILADGPWLAKDTPRNMMRDAGCQDEYDFNHDPTATRMASAWMSAAVSTVVLVLLMFAVLTMVMGSLFFVLRFAWLPFALLGFQLPGAARELSWGWLVGLFKSGATVAAMSFVISYLLMLISAFLTAPTLGLAERFSMILIMSGAMFLYRKQLLKGIDHFFERVRSELGSWRPGLAGRGSGGFTGSTSTGGSGATGFGVGQRSKVSMIRSGSRSWRSAGDVGVVIECSQRGEFVEPGAQLFGSVDAAAVGGNGAVVDGRWRPRLHDPLELLVGDVNLLVCHVDHCTPSVFAGAGAGSAGWEVEDELTGHCVGLWAVEVEVDGGTGGVKQPGEGGDGGVSTASFVGVDHSVADAGDYGEWRWVRPASWRAWASSATW